jgi:hypothetical protein
MGKLQGTTERPAIEVPETVTDSNSYIAAGEVLPKQPLNLQMTNPQIAADGVDECVIGNVPTGTSVEWPDGQTDEVTDGEVRFAVDLPGTYILTFDAVPYLRQEVAIEAVAAT